jgi:arsenite methyltransferase
VLVILAAQDGDVPRCGRVETGSATADDEETTAPTLQFDEDAGRRLEAMYTHPDVVERRRRVRQALQLSPGERVLDIGCGPGFLTGEMAAATGPNGWACGLDISESMLAVARHRCAGQPYAAWVDFNEGDAVALPFPDDAFDAAVATQVYEYVADVPRALSELYRVLRPGGRAVIVDTDWDSMVWHASDHACTKEIITAWDQHLTDPYLPRILRPELRGAGFDVPRVEVLNVLNIDWEGYSRGLAGLIAAFVVGRRGITQGDVDAWLEDLQRRGAEGSYFFSLDQYLFLATKPTS